MFKTGANHSKSRKITQTHSYLKNNWIFLWKSSKTRRQGGNNHENLYTLNPGKPNQKYLLVLGLTMALNFQDSHEIQI